MSVINVYEAKTRLSKLIEQAAAGDDVILGRSGKPVARITQISPKKRPIRFGLLKGKARVAKDFDAPLPAAVRARFEGH